MKEIWYQCWFPVPEEKQSLAEYHAKVFGFASDGTYITKHPERWLIGKSLKEYKPILIEMKAVVIKIN